MGLLMRDFDWASTTLGPSQTWPQALKIAVRLLLGTRHPMFIWWGPDLIQFYNDAYRSSLGPERHPQALGQKGRQCWEEIWPIIGPQIEQVMQGEGPTWQENALVTITRHGHREDVYWTYSYSALDEPSMPYGVGGVLVVCTETTDKVQALQRMATEREDFARLFEQAPTFMASLRGPEHCFELANPGYMRLVSPRQVIGKTVAEALPEAVSQGYVKLLDQVFASGEPFAANGSQFNMLCDDGSWIERYVDFVYQPMRNGAGEVVGIFVAGVDVTDRATSELALHRSEGQLRALNVDLESQVTQRSHERSAFWQVTTDLLGVLNKDGFFEKSNPAWRAVLGWSDEAVRTTPIFDMLHPDDVLNTRIKMHRLAFGQPALDFVIRCRAMDGEYKWISWTGVPEDGKYYCSGRDVTQEKLSQVALHAAQDALRQAQKMEAVGQLTGGIAHDFNNLLGSIGASLQVLGLRLQNGITHGNDRYITMGQESVRRAAVLTQRLLAFSRRQTLAPRPADANALVTGVLELIRHTVGPNVEVAPRFEANLWTVHIDASQLENCLLNLCINARDAMQPDGGVLSIRTANVKLDALTASRLELTAGEYVALYVGDTGSGMSEAVRARAFDPFYTTKPTGLGTGLGLSMVYGFIRQSRGQVSIDSIVGRGTVMSIYLPRHAGAVTTVLHPQANGTTLLGQGETILIIEDEPTLRSLMTEVLEGCGYRVVSAGHGAQGLQILQSSQRIDLLLTDVGLPGGMNGRQVADAGRALRPDIKVLFVTGYAEVAVLGQDGLGNLMEVMTKPFDVLILASRVRALLGTDRSN